ncbi:MAG TPA: GDSL-type esterase/lipase family protein [Opitutaceae bacterium]|jgi:lysophospholipase L1-like esterase
MSLSRLTVSAGLLLAAASPSASADPSSMVPASNPAFRYDGRIDDHQADAPVLIWENTQVAFDFVGPWVALDFRDGRDQNFFNVEVDGHSQEIGILPLVPNRIVIGPFADGHHHIVLDKRTEASTGHVTFAGVEPAPGGSIAPSPAPAYAHRFAFYGDSITVGACNEDGPVDQWIDRRSHNAALSYAALTANAFKADLQNISISGMGMAIGWTPFLTDQVWNRLYPDPTAVPVDPSVFHPDVVFTNYGENDGSFATARKMAFPSASYLERYVAWVHELRATYPAAEIVILRGGMFNGANNPDLRSAWEAAVAKIESADPRVAHFVFKHWSGNHPRVPDDRAMADELVDWLHGQPFLGPHAP